MKKILVLSIILLAASCKSGKITANSPKKYNLEALEKVIVQGNLKEIYPDANIAEGADLFDEGTVEREYSILYPDTQDELLIIWEGSEKTKLHQIHYEGDGRWRSNTGIAIGTTFEDLVALNGGPIDVYGFGWDYSGAVDFKNGKLEASNVRVFLAPENAPPQSFYGDQIIDPGLVEEIKNLKLKVRAITYQPD
ncbi:hypothetical protein [Salinimicrobium oceani]|uniref:Lipoprotein n=1 Tax=Salinimicrobium oceani TaxID=2722702 RepID=A0ABX1CVE6_9FLAO|nr:hypothetical protein [Salinimicrobium oceani]NJW52242.1 hypothetical protein [Salinimicrobium oceani]